MSASAVLSTQLGRYSILMAELPSRGVVNLGILLQDPQSNRFHLRLRRDLAELVDEEDMDVFPALAEDLLQKATELGAEKLFEYLLDTLSGSIRITDRETVIVENFDRALDRLYRKHVESTVLQFRTHLPKYSLRAAAGKFLDNEEISEQGWIEAPEDLRKLYPDMFVAEIAGHSMEPLIPDGSLCIFRANVVGSRTGRLVLVEDRENNAYAVKRYHSEKDLSDGAWRHVRIHLQSLNPGYPSWDLDPDEDKYRIVAEFIRVLD